MSDLPLNQIICEDVFSFMDKLPNNCVDLVCTDCPYEFISKNPAGGGFMKKENKKHLEAINENFGMSFDPKEFLEKCKRICQPFNGYFFTNKSLLKDYINFAEQNNYKWDLLIWRKTNPVPIFNGHYMIDKEYCVYIKETGSFFDSKLGYQNYFTFFEGAIGNNETAHPSAKPLSFIERLIMVSCPENGVVFDGYLGGGTVAKACQNLKRNFLACDNNETYCEMARDRLKQKSLL